MSRIYCTIVGLLLGMMCFIYLHFEKSDLANERDAETRYRFYEMEQRLDLIDRDLENVKKKR